MITRRLFIGGAAALGPLLLAPKLADAATGHKALTADEVLALASVVAGEARGQPLRGQHAVVCVVLNRVRSRSATFAKDVDIVAACTRPHQFHPLRHSPYPVSAALVHEAYDNWVRGQDPSRAATAFLDVNDHPYWARRLRPVAVIGGHRFFKVA